MLNNQLIRTSYPSLQLQDKAGFALQLMDDYDLHHLPVVSEEKFVGMVCKEDLLDVDEATPVAVLEDQWVRASVKGEAYFLASLKLANEHQLSLIPVVNEQGELAGCIPASELLLLLGNFTGAADPGGVIVLEMDKRHFSFGEISRLVETNDAYITQLNTYHESDSGLFIVAIRINKAEISDIVATFQRYEYAVRYYFGDEQYANELKSNYDHLLNYLNI
jgi:CBS domain-containing protein